MRRRAAALRARVRATSRSACTRSGCACSDSPVLADAGAAGSGPAATPASGRADAGGSGGAATSGPTSWSRPCGDGSGDPVSASARPSKSLAVGAAGVSSGASDRSAPGSAPAGAAPAAGDAVSGAASGVAVSSPSPFARPFSAWRRASMSRLMNRHLPGVAAESGVADPHRPAGPRADSRENRPAPGPGWRCESLADAERSPVRYG